MKLVSIHMKGFRNQAEADWQLFDQTIITGPNRTGKSTIAEAIVWCLHSTDITGVTNKDSDLMMDGAKSMSVTLIAKIDNEEVTIHRERSEGKTQTFLVDGAKPKAGWVESVFGNPKEFLSMFIPGFFSSLGPSDARLVLNSVMPFIKQESVMMALTEENRIILGKTKLTAGLESVNTRTNTVRGNKTDSETELLRLEGEQRFIEETLEKEQPQMPVLKLSDVQKAEGQALLDQLAVARSEISGRAKKIAQLEKERTELGSTYRTLEKGIEQVNDKCPTCGQPLPAEALKEAVAKVKIKNENIKSQMTKALEKGKVVKAEIDTLKALPEGQVDPELVTKVEQYQKDVAADQMAETTYQVAKAAFDKAQNDRERVQKDIVTVTAYVERLGKEIEALVAYRNKYLEIQHAELSKRFEHVNIKVTEEGKQNAYQVTYDGRPVRRLAHSDTVRCDIEIGRVLAKSKGQDIPVFIDNAELVQDLFDLNFGRQMLTVFVSKTPLAVRDYAVLVAAARRKGA